MYMDTLKQDVFPDNPIGFSNCPKCKGIGYIYNKRATLQGKDYSKSSRGKKCWIEYTYYIQCPLCDPKNRHVPLLSCPLCEGEHTNDNTCPYCDMWYGKLQLMNGCETLYHYENICGYGSTKMEVLKYLVKEIEKRCKPYRKEDPQVFQYHPLAYAYRRVLREAWL